MLGMVFESRDWVRLSSGPHPLTLRRPGCHGAGLCDAEHVCAPQATEAGRFNRISRLPLEVENNFLYHRRMQHVSAEPVSNTAKRIVLIVATFGSFMTPFDGSVVTLALPTIGKDLGGDVVSLGWVATAYVIGLTICVIPFGRLADIRGRGRIYALGVGLFTFASLLCSLAPSLNALIATRFIQGVAAAMMAGNSIALLTGVFPASERGKVLGINTGTVYVGLSVGPSLGGFLVEHFGWRSVFYVNVPIGTVVVLLALFKLQREKIEGKPRGSIRSRSLPMGWRFS